MPISIDRDTFYTFDEAAALFGLDPEDFRRASPKGKRVRTTTVGDSFLIRGDHLLEYLEGYLDARPGSTERMSSSRADLGIDTARISGIMRTGEFGDPLDPKQQPKTDEAPKDVPDFASGGSSSGNVPLFDPAKSGLPAGGAQPRSSSGSGEFRSFLDAGASSDYEQLKKTREEGKERTAVEESEDEPLASTRFNIDALVEEAREIERRLDTDEDTAN